MYEEGYSTLVTPRNWYITNYTLLSIFLVERDSIKRLQKNNYN